MLLQYRVCHIEFSPSVVITESRQNASPLLSYGDGLYAFNLWMKQFSLMWLASSSASSNPLILIFYFFIYLIQKLRQKEVDEESCVKTCSMNWGEANSVYTSYIVSSASNGKIQAGALIFVLVGYIDGTNDCDVEMEAVYVRRRECEGVMFMIVRGLSYTLTDSLKLRIISLESSDMQAKSHNFGLLLSYEDGLYAFNLWMQFSLMWLASSSASSNPLILIFYFFIYVYFYFYFFYEATSQFLNSFTIRINGKIQAGALIFVLVDTFGAALLVEVADMGDVDAEYDMGHRSYELLAE
ncbi:hypothetical protein Tco_0422327 [Tanacetum coccineum]